MGSDDHVICIYLWPVFVAPVGAACGDERAGGNDTRMPMDHAEEIRELTERVRGYERSYRSEEHTSELQSPLYLVCRLLLEKKKSSA